MTNQAILDSLFASGGIDLRRGALFDSLPPPMPAEAWQRVEGMLLGLAIGDALGNTTEGLRPAERHKLYGEIRDYLPNAHAAGRRVGLPSDDSQLAFWMLESLLDRGVLDPEDLSGRNRSMNRLRVKRRTALRLMRGLC